MGCVVQAGFNLSNFALDVVNGNGAGMFHGHNSYKRKGTTYEK